MSWTFTRISSGWYLWSPAMCWTVAWVLCTLHCMEPSWPPNKEGLGEIGPKPRSQLTNHRAGAGGQDGLLPYHGARLLPLCLRGNF